MELTAGTAIKNTPASVERQKMTHATSGYNFATQNFVSIRSTHFYQVIFTRTRSGTPGNKNVVAKGMGFMKATSKAVIPPENPANLVSLSYT
ncbi:hypothetical protein CCR75_002887 [Bremia lactucae]|uniref:Uncharacterized protein n=1 Tax=Bremia lactucae TaxID=4779 RepID=A0A976IEV9_BRELC|nr:hypothetical protein CCR75_002887 [Bremia lactucae]